MVREERRTTKLARVAHSAKKKWDRSHAQHFFINRKIKAQYLFHDRFSAKNGDDFYKTPTFTSEFEQNDLSANFISARVVEQSGRINNSAKQLAETSATGRAPTAQPLYSLRSR